MSVHLSPAQKELRERLQKLSVMIVDEQRFARSLLMTQLANYGITTTVECSDSLEAINYLRANNVDLVISDYDMSPLDGVDLARFIRREADILDPEVPIIMLSGYSDVARVKEASMAGINEYLGKPVSADALFKRIQRIVLEPRPFVRTEHYVGPAPRKQRIASSSYTCGR